MKKALLIGGVVVVLLVGGSLWSRALSDSDGSPVVSHNGLHWHPTLALYVGDEQVAIPHNLGLGAIHKSIHTHDDLPTLHLEFDGTVREEDMMLGKFFENWGVDIRSFGENMRMTVNGIPNTEYERYRMRDRDVIELRYDPRP